MKLLLDTHVLLWWLADDPLLPPPARDAITTPENEVFVSAASAWEIAIKKAAGRLVAPDDLLDAIAASYFMTLPISVAHATIAGGLHPHHSDPFDRMLIAQAMAEGPTVISLDARFSE